MDSSRRLRLRIAFDGAGYHGWQAGRSGRGVADVLQSAMEPMGVADNVVSSSRTDSGVHARGLVAHADVRGAWTARDACRVRDFLNRKLPADIRVCETEWVSDAFHARFDALWKEYRYVVWNDAVMNPLLAGRAWHVPQALDLGAMREAAGVFVGRHDFHAFTCRRDGELGGAVREIQALRISRRDDELTFILRSDGFLYKMCRAIVGTLVDIGRGRMSEEELLPLLESDAVRTPGTNAPACGLVLWRVGYP